MNIVISMMRSQLKEEVRATKVALEAGRAHTNVNHKLSCVEQAIKHLDIHEELLKAIDILEKRKA